MDLTHRWRCHMQDLPEAGNLLHGRRRGDWHLTVYRCWILTATASTLHISLAPGSGTMDAANAMGTSSRRPANAVGNAIDAMQTSGRGVRSGMIYIFSNYRLKIKNQYHASLVKYRFLRSYSAKSRIYIVFHEFYDHLTCLYLCLGGFRLIAWHLGGRSVHPNDAEHKRWRGRAQRPGEVMSGAF
jgi:hypothetical protein